MESVTVHTFKNYLHVSLSYCDLLLDELPEDSKLRVDVLEIQNAVQQAVALLPQLLGPGDPQGGEPLK